MLPTQVCVALALMFPHYSVSEGKRIGAPNVIEAGWELQKLPNERVGITATPTKDWPAWNDEGKFPIKATLSWVRLSITVTKPKLDRFELHILEASSIEKTKGYLLELALLQHYDYGRCGKYLVKGSPVALDWFAKHYQLERYMPLAQRLGKK